MNNTKTIKTFQKINIDEVKLLQRFVHSSYFNMHEGVIKLFEALLPYYPTFNSTKLKREKLYKKVFPGEKYDYQKISDVMTYLTRVLDQFITQRTYENDLLLSKRVKSKAYREYNMPRRFEKKLKRELETNYRNNNSARECYWHQYRLEEESDLFFTAKDSRTRDKSIERKTKHLDHFYFSSKLKNACEMLNRQNIVQENYEIEFLDPLVNYIESNPELFNDYPDILIYHSILKTIQEPDKEQYYTQLINQLNEHKTVIFADELRSMYDFAQNYCIKKINQGKQKYLNEIFSIFKTLLEIELIYENGILSEWDYKNIVTVGTRLKEYRWIENFIVQYKDKLESKTRHNAYHYNLAALHYSEGDYDKAMRLLQTVEFTDVYYNLGGRCLLLKSYYESDEMEPLFSLIETFKAYLRRNKLISPYQYTAHMNLVRFTKKLATIHNMQYSSKKTTIQKQIEQLKKRMDKQSEISNANWLVEQIGKIESTIN